MSEVASHRTAATKDRVRPHPSLTDICGWWSGSKTDRSHANSGSSASTFHQRSVRTYHSSYTNSATETVAKYKTSLCPLRIPWMKTNSLTHHLKYFKIMWIGVISGFRRELACACACTCACACANTPCRLPVLPLDLSVPKSSSEHQSTLLPSIKGVKKHAVYFFIYCILLPIYNLLQQMPCIWMQKSLPRIGNYLSVNVAEKRWRS